MPEPTRWWPYGAGIIGAFLLVLMVYGPALRGPFLFDDIYLPMFGAGNERLLSPTWIGFLRPLTNFTLWCNYQLSDLKPDSYHFVNLLLHTLAAGAVGLFLFWVVRRVEVSRPAARLLALLGAGVFLLHPLATEAVAYIAQRGESLCAMFFYLAMVVFLYRQEGAIQWGRVAAVVGLFLAAFLSKEHAFTLPALLLLTDYWWQPEFSFAGIRQNWRLYALLGIGAVFGAFVGLKVMLSSTSAGFGLKEFTWYQYLFTQGRAIWIYVKLFFVPGNLNGDYDFPISRSLTDHGAVAGLGALLLVSIAAFWYRRRFPLAGYGWFVFLLLLVPTSSVLPIADPIADRRAYLPMVGLILVVLEVARQRFVSRTVLLAGGLVWLSALAYMTYQRSFTWSDPIAFWHDAVEKNPQKYRARFQLAHAYYQTNRCAEAAQEYQQALALQQPDFRVLLDAALADDCLGQTDTAISKVKRALQEAPDQVHVITTLGMLYGKKGDRTAAMATLDKALQLDGNYALAHDYKGVVFAQAGEWAEAATEFQRALATSPADETARNGLLAAQANLKGR